MSRCRCWLGGLATSQSASARCGVVEWSHDLLGEAEKVAFARLSVFSGGFTPEAAEAVLLPPPKQDTSAGRPTLDLVFSLLDKSLLVASAADEGRFGMLETIRAYGLERLEASGEERSARRRHEDFFVGLGEEAETHLNGPDRDFWMRHLETEHDNIRAALSYSLSEGRTEVALRLAVAIFWFWLNGGHWSEGRSWFERALGPGPESADQPQADLPTPAIRGKALYSAGALASFQGDYAASFPLLEESAALWRELGSPTDLGYTLMFQNVEAMGKGEIDRALSLARESVALFRKTDDTFSLAVALSAQGTAHRAWQEFAEAHIALEESARIARRTNDDWLLALPLQYLGLVTFQQGEYEEAEAYLKESLIPSIRRSGDEWFGASLLEALATLAAYRGDPTRAARLYGAAEAMREEIGTTVLPYEVTEHERGVMSAREALGDEGFAAAWAEGRTMTPEQRIAEAVG
jgi:tetratricopeptide (TPR) repeat protein